MATSPKPTEPKLLDQVRTQIRTKHPSRRTEVASVGWICRFVIFHDLQHPASLSTADVQRFLSHLAVTENVAASTQTWALAALPFIYRHVLRQELGESERYSSHVAPASPFDPPDVRGSSCRARGAATHFEAHRLAPLRVRSPSARGAAPPGEGKGLRQARDHRTGREGRRAAERSADELWFAETAAGPPRRPSNPKSKIKNPKSCHPPPTPALRCGCGCRTTGA